MYNDMIKYYNKYNFLPGKGMLVLNEEKNADLLLHNYQIYPQEFINLLLH